MAPIPIGLTSDVDLFSDEVLEQPYDCYKALRDLGPAAYLRRHDVWFLGRYEEVRTALSDWGTYSSVQGIGLNPVINEAWANALICVDPPAHTELRRLVTERLGPRHLAPIADTIDRRANELADRLVEMGEFDAVADLAHDLPINVIMDLVGWPDEVRPDLLDLAAGSFDCCGPQNSRMSASMPKLGLMFELVNNVYEAGTLAPGGFGSTIADAARSGQISKDTAIGMLFGYVVAAFDTTINAIASGAWLFAANPGQWDALRAEPALANRAFNEIIRLESPIQHFSRVATREVGLGENAVIPAGARVIVSYASANRDERRYLDPDRFDLARAELDHLAFGVGVHGCAGQSLARLEGHAVFKALARRTRVIEVAGEPGRALNNMTRGFSHLPVRLN